MAGNGPRPCGRQIIACRVADLLWTTTVSGWADVCPQAVASMSEKTIGNSANVQGFGISHSSITHREREFKLSDLRRETLRNGRLLAGTFHGPNVSYWPDCGPDGTRYQYLGLDFRCRPVPVGHDRPLPGCAVERRRFLCVREHPGNSPVGGNSNNRWT